MADRDLDQPYLALRRPGYAGRTFLGGLQLSTRTGLFVALGLLATIVFAGIVVHVNDRVAGALRGLVQAQTLTAAVTRVERGQSDLRSREKQYTLTRDGRQAQEIRRLLDETARSLDILAAHPDADEIARAVSTLRDGFVQYDQHLATLEGAETSSVNPAAAGAALRDTDAALGPRVATSGRRDGMQLLARINQMGSEIVLTGDPTNLEPLQEAYKTLGKSMAASSLPRGDKRVITGLLDRHQAATMALITARISVNEDAQRFDDIQLYMAPSLDAMRMVSEELLSERSLAVADARKFAAASLIGGGTAVILWVLALGLIVMRSLTRPVEALAHAADRLARGDRTVMLPGRGNRDAIGYLARAFDDWIAAMADAEHLRQDLEHAQTKTLRAVGDLAAETKRAQAAVDEMEALRRTLADYRIDMDEMEALLAEFVEDQARNEETSEEVKAPDAAVDRMPANSPMLPATAPPLSSLARAQAEAQTGGAGRDPAFAQVSDHLARISDQASAAIIDVELTDALVRNLVSAREQLDALGGHVLAVRDEFNQFLFSQSPITQSRSAGDGEQPANTLAGPEARRALAAIRDAVDRAERAMGDCAREVERVTETAQRLAASASDEARQATDQLVAQSEHLQGLLETLTHRTRPQVITGPKVASGSNEVRKSGASGPQDRNAG